MRNKIDNKDSLLMNIGLVVCLIIVLLVPYFVFAQENLPLETIKRVQEGGAGFAQANEYSLSETMGTIISGFLTLLGILFIILMIYAGYNWMIAAGDHAKVEKAQDAMRRAIIGLILTVSAYAFWNIIFYNVLMPGGGVH